MFRISGIQRQVLISECIYLGQMLVCYTVSWTGPVLPKLRDLEQSPLPYLLTETELSLIASLLFIGGLPGPYIMGWLSNVKGRKPCLLFGGIFIAISYTILATATNLAMLYCGRVFAGFGTGIIGVMNLVYVGEIASTHIRGILLTIVGIFTTVGSIVMFSVGPFLSFKGTTYVGLALSFTFIACAIMIPETPIFHILEGNDDAAKNILNKLGRVDDVDKFLASKQMLTETTTAKDWFDLFRLRGNRRGLFIVVISNILQQCSGIMAVVFFASIIFDMAGSSIDANISMIIIGCFQLSGSIITPFIIERLGRKTLLIVSSTICSFSMITLGLYFYLDHIQNPIMENFRWLPLMILIIFFIGYDFGLGIIPNVLIGEMFTTNVRSKGSAVAMTSSWLTGFVITTAFGSMMENIGGYGSFWVFAMTCGCAVVYTIFFIPETKGKSLLEIQDILSK